MKPINMLKVKDKNEKYYKPNGRLIDYPASVILAGKSMISGKSNALTNLLLRKEFKFEKHLTAIISISFLPVWIQTINYN